MSYEDWEDLYENLTNSWNGQEEYDEEESDEEEYDDEESDEEGSDVIADILHILEADPTKENAQEGLDGLIKACIDGSRYSHEEIYVFKPVVKKMIDMGAEFDLKNLIIPEYTNRDHFESDVVSFALVKSMLLKIFPEHIEIPKEIIDATPIDWEKMVERNQNRCYRLSSKYTYTEAYYNAIKYFYVNYDD